MTGVLLRRLRDLVLILVMQNTVREPLLMLISAYTSSA